MPDYTVYVDDNFHYMDESERYKLGHFNDCRSAVAACQSIVDEFLAKIDPNCTPGGMYKHYTMFGEDPWISSEDPGCKFSAWSYASQRCHELATKPDEPPQG